MTGDAQPELQCLPITPAQAESGATTEEKVVFMRKTWHKSSVILAKYIRIGQTFTHHAAAGLGV
ncbi:MAG: hypothetical protein ABSD59_22985 [Terracidiphilus sp.]|jgi:hypothetical protein